MKNITFAIFIALTAGHADLSVNEIQKMVFEIHEKREGIALTTLEDTKEPFVHMELENNESTYIAPEKKEKELYVHAILNNKAYINDAWFGLDETIDTYTLKYIGKNGVVLRSENRIKKLFLHEKKENYISMGQKD